jgi:hypothetical protein
LSLEEQYAEAQRLLEDVLRRKERIQSDPDLIKLTKLIFDLNAKLASEIDAQAEHREREKQALAEIEKYLKRWG